MQIETVTRVAVIEKGDRSTSHQVRLNVISLPRVRFIEGEDVEPKRGADLTPLEIEIAKLRFNERKSVSEVATAVSIPQRDVWPHIYSIQRKMKM